MASSCYGARTSGDASMLRLRLVTSQGSPYPSRSPRAHPSGTVDVTAVLGLVGPALHAASALHAAAVAAAVQKSALLLIEQRCSHSEGLSKQRLLHWQSSGKSERHP